MSARLFDRTARCERYRIAAYAQSTASTRSWKFCQSSPRTSACVSLIGYPVEAFALKAAAKSERTGFRLPQFGLTLRARVKYHVKVEDVHRFPDFPAKRAALELVDLDRFSGLLFVPCVSPLRHLEKKQERRAQRKSVVGNVRQPKRRRTCVFSSTIESPVAHVQRKALFGIGMTGFKHMLLGTGRQCRGP